METMEELIRANETKTTSYEITDEMVEKYSDPDYPISRDEPHEDRPVLIAEGLYPATMVDWSAGFNSMYKKSVFTMRFQIGHEVILGPGGIVRTSLSKSTNPALAITSSAI